MIARRGIPPSVTLTAALALAAALATATQIETGNPAATFERGLGVSAALAAILLSLAVRPAWPLSIGVALTVFSGHWDIMGIPVAFDRVLIITAIVAALVRARQDGDPLRTRPIDWALILVAAYAIVSALLAGTLDEHTPRFALLDRLALVGFALFYVAPRVFRTDADRRVLLGTLVALGGYLGVTALLEKVGPEALILPQYITDPSIGTHHDRARGPFTEAGANGLMLFFCAVGSALAALSWRDRRARAAAGIVVALCLLGVLLTVTRAAWLGAIAGTLAALLAARETRRYVPRVVLASIAAVLLAFAVIPGLYDQATNRANADAPLWDRRNSNAAALRMIADKPVLGFGWGRYAPESLDYYRQTQDYPLTFVTNVHNVYLANAVDLGLLGALLWLAVVGAVVLGSILRRGPPARRPWKMGLVALVLAYAVVATTTPLGFTAPTLLLWTWAGLAWGDD
jgi:putative inorganic carbon (hco3(-)) transporter